MVRAGTRVLFTFRVVSAGSVWSVRVAVRQWVRTAPTRRMMDLRLGKMPTTSVNRQISRLKRSLRLLDPDLSPHLS